MAKCEQCPAFKTALLEIGEDEIIEDTGLEYWTRGLNGVGQNMLGKLQVIEIILLGDFNIDTLKGDCY